MPFFFQVNFTMPFFSRKHEITGNLVTLSAKNERFGKKKNFQKNLAIKSPRLPQSYLIQSLWNISHSWLVHLQ